MVTVLAVSVAASGSDSVVGVWHGNIRYDLSKLPPTLPSYKKDHLATEAKQRLNDKFTLTLKKDNKFTLVVEGPKPPPPMVVGKWSRDGNNIQVQVVRDGKPSAPQAFILSKNGRALTFEQPGSPATYHFWR